MEVYEYGNPAADRILIQMVDDHDLEFIEREVDAIKREVDAISRGMDATARGDFRLIAIQVGDWNKDLSPWKAPAVFGKEDFGDGAGNTLAEVLSYCKDETKTYYIGGYSLAALFALWAAYQTDKFSGVAAASPSIWFPGFVDYMKEHEIQSRSVYLSLGDKEEKTRNAVMATVGEKIREAHSWLESQGVRCTLEWNQGNHFKDADIRTAKAFAWVMKR
ncbi:MAG: esterase [Lachnospiraceae bacterium]|nr:esterase [Lachnospiraceae bacterium]